MNNSRGYTFQKHRNWKSRFSVSLHLMNWVSGGEGGMRTRWNALKQTASTKSDRRPCDNDKENGQIMCELKTFSFSMVRLLFSDTPKPLIIWWCAISRVLAKHENCISQGRIRKNANLCSFHLNEKFDFPTRTHWGTWFFCAMISLGPCTDYESMRNAQNRCITTNSILKKIIDSHSKSSDRRFCVCLLPPSLSLSFSLYQSSNSFQINQFWCGNDGHRVNSGVLVFNVTGCLRVSHIQREKSSILKREIRSQNSEIPKIEKNFMCSRVFKSNQIKGNRMELSLRRLFTIGVYIMCVFIVCEIGRISAQRTILDKFINEYRSFRGGLFKFVGRSDTESAYLWNLKRQVTTTTKWWSIITQDLKTTWKKIHQILFGFDVPWWWWDRSFYWLNRKMHCTTLSVSKFVSFIHSN